VKAAFITHIGDPDVIEWGDLPDPVPGPRDALVRVRAAAINPIDTYVRAGTVAMPLRFPFVVGCDLAGEVVAVGAEVDRLRPGMRVWGSNQGLLGRQGTCAEFATVDERWLYPTPDGVTDREAAAAALVSITAHLGLVSHARLCPNETIFVSGGSGGVGSAVIQIAKALGGHVIATAGTPAKRQLVLGFGADVALDYRQNDLVAAVLDREPGGVHVHWETRREPDFDTALAMLAERGRMVIMAGREARPRFPVGPFYVKGCSLHGFVMFLASAQEQAAAAADINRWLSRGQLRAPVDRVVTLAHVAEAHALQEAATVGGSGALAGKIVVEP
jgi:NADPH2:quinone reductase